MDTIIRFMVAVPSQEQFMDKEAKEQAISKVRRAINAWVYGEVGVADDCPCCEERAIFDGKCHACPFDAR